MNHKDNKIIRFFLDFLFADTQSEINRLQKQIKSMEKASNNIIKLKKPKKNGGNHE